MLTKTQIGTKTRKIKATFIAWVNDKNDIRIISGEDKKSLVKEAKRIMEEITPKGQKSKASLWRNGKIIASVSFPIRVKKQPQV